MSLILRSSLGYSGGPLNFCSADEVAWTCGNVLTIYKLGGTSRLLRGSAFGISCFTTSMHHGLIAFAEKARTSPSSHATHKLNHPLPLNHRPQYLQCVSTVSQTSNSWDQSPQRLNWTSPLLPFHPTELALPSPPPNLSFHSASMNGSKGI